MFDAFSAWNRMIAAGWTMTQTGLRLAETWGAAHDVVNMRTALIASAVHSPMKSDHRELARMVPEKVDAFSRAGSAAVSAWWQTQSAWAAEMQHLGAVTMRGRPPTLVELVDLGERMATLGLKSIESAARLGSTSVAPIHIKATSNARRLKRRVGSR